VLGESLTRASAALAIVSVAGVLSVGACGVLPGGSDDVQGTGAASPAAPTGTKPSPASAARPGASTAAPGSAFPAAAPADAAGITELTRTVVLADKVGDICREKLSAKFVMTAFKTVKRCERTWDDGDDSDASERITGVTVSDIRVSGLAATARVTEVYGDARRVSGTWAFLRAGRQWRVAALGVDFLRAGLASEFGPGYRADGPMDMFGYPTTRTCLTGKFARLSDDAFTNFAYGIMREDKTVVATFQHDALACAAVPDAHGVSALRYLIELGMRQSLEAKGMSKLLDCATGKERRTISDAAILAAYERFLKTHTYPPDFLRQAFHIGAECAAEAATAPPTKLV